MPKPRFGPHIVLDVQRDQAGKYTAVLEQAGPASETLAGTTPCGTEAFALRQLAQRVVVLPLLYPERLKSDEILERMTEADRAKLAPHLRQSAQDIAEMMAAAVGRIDALTVLSVTKGPDECVAAHLARAHAALGINVDRECLQDARAALTGTDDKMTREELLSLVSNLRRVLGVS